MANAGTPYDEPGTLMNTVRTMLKEDDRTLIELHVESGIPFYWLRNFASGMYKNPSVNRVEYLYKVLSGNDLIGE